MGKFETAAELLQRLRDGGDYGTPRLGMKMGRAECRDLLGDYHESSALTVAEIAGRAVAA